MNLNYEIIQYFVYKKLVKNSLKNKILEDCERIGLPIEQYLIANNYCSETTALAALGEFYNMPYAEMDMFEPKDELVDMFNLQLLRKHKFVPVFINENGVMLLAVGRPLDFNARSMIALVYSGEIDCVLVPSTQIDIYIDSLTAVRSTASALENLQRAKDDSILQKANTAKDESVEDVEDVINAPAVKLVDSIIKEAIPFRASDIHIEPFEESVKVRYRIDGVLNERAIFPIESYPSICARLKIISGMNIAERRIPQDGRIALKINGVDYDFRVSTLPTVNGEKFVIRILDKSSFNFTRAELGFTPEENLIIDKILAHPHGVILLAGPTGCGKSTTLYSFLREINSEKVNIVTVEDPVEYTLEGINQTQVNVKANMTFAAALRSILRQDPDIIMLGEIRDEETSQIAIRAAITGHLVFSTLHTNDAPGAVTRLVDMGTSSYLVADALVAVISQRLVKKLCPACKKKAKTKPYEMQELGIDEPVGIYRPHGCQFCNNTGYKGRIAVHEVMYVDDEMKLAINDGMNAAELRRLAISKGMITLTDSCKKYVLNGTTSLAEYMLLSTD